MLAMQGQCGVSDKSPRARAQLPARRDRRRSRNSGSAIARLSISFLSPAESAPATKSKNQPLLDWIKSRAEQAEVIATVCTGTAILARTGLLDGRKATSNKAVFAWVASQGPRVNWIKEARWVEDGKFATSSGVSAGIDMALALIARLYGAETAEKIAIQMEYDWHRDADWDPFAKIHGLV